MLRVAWNDRKYLKIAGIGDANDYDYDNCDEDDDDHEKSNWMALWPFWLSLVLNIFPDKWKIFWPLLTI